MKKKITSLIMATAMMTVMLSPAAVFAEDPEAVSITDASENGNEQVPVDEEDILISSDDLADGNEQAGSENAAAVYADSDSIGITGEEEDGFFIEEDKSTPAEEGIFAEEENSITAEDEKSAENEKAEEQQVEQQQAGQSLRDSEIPLEEGLYTRNAALMDGLPGVYTTKAYPGESNAGDSPATMGIPSVAKQNLENGPTHETPAIIRGAAVNYERKVGPTDYEPFVPGTERVAPYKYFRYGKMEEQRQEPDGSTSTHIKLTGFDGTYFIIRVDVSEIISKYIDEKDESAKFLHVRQESNKALMVASGLDTDKATFWTYSDALGSKTGSYSLNNYAAALKDNGDPSETAYLDVIVLSSGKLAAGADAGAADAPSADIKLNFYVDDVNDYNTAIEPLDPNNMPTFPYLAPDGVTYQLETDYNAALLKKFYRDENAKEETNASGYIVKGSDLEIDVMVDEQESPEGVNDYWSLTKAMEYQPYDSHIVRLICEAPVLEGLHVQSTDGSPRHVYLDVNSFDIQVANNTETGTAGILVEKDAELRILDGTNTSGAELAIGNNATMVIKKGGTLTIDESCTAEVEYDAATITDPSQTPAADAFNGEITIEDGGTLVNYGVVNIEGTEAKPIDPAQQEPVVTDIKPTDMIIEHGGTFNNYGCLSLKGILYVMGILNNFGKFSETITAVDPDKGTTVYHKGIQVTWKDVVTREGVEPGFLNVGIDAYGNIENRAMFNNYGDIVIFPGTFNLYGTFNNLPTEDASYKGHMYLCTVDEAIIPIIPTQENPTQIEELVKVDPPRESYFNVKEGGVVNSEDGLILAGRVKLLHNGVPDTLTEVIPLDKAEVKLSADTFVYNKKVQKPVVESVTLDGKKLAEGTDYYIKWPENCKNAGAYTITIYGKGDYGTQVKANYKIEKAEQTIKVDTPVSLVNGKNLTLKPTGAQGTLTYASADKTIATVGKSTGKVTAKSVGSVKITVTAAASENYKKATAKVTVKVVPAATASLKAANVSNGIKLAYQKVDGAKGYKIYRGSKLLATIKKQTTVSYTDKTASNGSKYTYKVVPYASTGDGAAKSVTAVYVAPQASKPVLASTTAKKMTVSWKKNAKATGYQIRYSTSSKFTDSTTKTTSVNSVSTLSKKIGKLTSGRTYYVEVRNFKTVDGKKKYSAWSAANSIKVK